MLLSAKERQGRGLDALAGGLRSYVEAGMCTVLPAASWIALYEAKEMHRRNRPFRLSLDDPRQLLQMIRYERSAFPSVDASQRAWVEELIQAANRAAHVMVITDREADRSLDTMLLLAESIGLDAVVAQLVALRLDAVDSPSANTAVDAEPESVHASSTTAPERWNAPTEAEVTSPQEPSAMAPLPGLDDLPAGMRLLSASIADVECVIVHHDAVNWALTHNAVSPIQSLRITNIGAAAVNSVTVEVALQAPAILPGQTVGAPLRLQIGTLEAGESFEAQTPDLAMLLSPAVFVQLDEATTTSLTLALQADGATAVSRGAVRLLTADEWWAGSIPELLAAFVRPNDPVIGELLRSASRLIDERTGSSSLEGYQSGPARVRDIAEALYDALGARRVTYAEPPASFEGTGQRIRTHGQVFTEGLGTCLDLACLYAAALEQAGIHPVLAVFEGHAFTGYLTEEEQLPVVAVRDEATAITIADSDFFDAVETTCACGSPASFEDARQATSHWWTTDIDQLRFLLDVHAAHHRVRPLPSVRLQDGVRVIEVAQDPQWSAPRRPPARTSPRASTSPSRTDVPARIQRWERALLDMTYANPLLKRKPATSLAVHMPAGAIGEFEDEVAAGVSFRLIANDEIDQIHRAQGARSAADVDPASVRAILQRERALFIATPERDYSRRLKSLARRSKTSVEETGADNLYLTLGALHWTDGARRGAAPLFLVPVRLTGGRGVTRYSLAVDESRERVPNYCLIEKLKTFGLRVPELETPDADGSGIDLVGALGALRSAILRTRNTQGFHVEESADLALLQFSTLEMWQDLREHWPAFLKRPALAHLVHSAGSVFDDGITPPEPRALDEAETYLPIPADGSQIEAIRWAASGKTFILEGPPGTGKSQTITNLIADSMATGRRVLFVAEKAAALEVVQRRLDAIGLGVFSLDVHGRTQTVSAVRDQLRTALEEHAQPEQGWEPLRSAYASVMARLADYPVRLHETGPAGLSAWDARQLVLEQVGLGTREQDAVDVPAALVRESAALPDLYDLARQLGAALIDLGCSPRLSPWRLSGLRELDQLPRDEVAAAVRELRTARTALVGHSEAAALARGLRAEQLDALEGWLRTVESGCAWPPAVAAELTSGPWLQEAQRRQEAVTHFRRRVSAELGPFTAAALELPTEAMLVRARLADAKFFGRKRRRRQLLAELRPALRGEIALADVTPALAGVDALRREREDLRRYAAELPGVGLRTGWDPLDESDTSWLSATVSAISSASQLHAVAAGGLSDDRRADYANLITELLTSQSTRTERGSAAVARWAAAWRGFASALRVNDVLLEGWLAGRPLEVGVEADLAAWSSDASGTALVELQRWTRLTSLLDKFLELEMTALVQDALDGQLDPYEVEARVRLGAARAVLDERLSTTGLSGFDEVDHARRVADLASRADTIRQRMPNQLKAQVLAARTFNPSAAVGQVAELRAELGRRRGGRSVRRLLHDFEPLITQITPCLLMSPQSVARFLPSTAAFDLVVFDEASQIRVPEAIGALGRANAAVVVGDSKQMPPTSMFAGSEGASDDEEGSGSPEPVAALVPTDLESILTESVESQFPRKLLSWHYRSRNESLIAFSNARYYEGRLSSFPVAPGSAEKPVKLRRVGGIWEGGARGAARVNRAEASEVVAEVRRLLADDAERSIGVVTFNSQQRDLVLDLLEADQDPAVAGRLQAEHEPLFVKNLENVQGDERDVIVFTLAFSRDERGRIPLNWGPLTLAGGERRLNVAITRAKERVIVVSSFDPVELDLSGSNSQGLNDLKDYLLLASTDRTTNARSRGGARDAHLHDLAGALTAAGLDVRTNVGLSEFVVDLAVRRQGSDRWLAVLLDGPAWAARLSVGDRETLPLSVLTQMGWAQVERVWLPTWLRSRTQVVESVVKCADALAETPNAPASETRVKMGQAAAPPPVEPRSRPDPTPLASSAAPAHKQSARPAFSPASDIAVHASEHLDSTGWESLTLVRQEIESVIAAEGPILVDRLVQVVAHRFGLSRVRERRARQLEQVVLKFNVLKSENSDRVVWPPGVARTTYAEFRLPGPGQQRPLIDIPYEELRNAMVHVVRDSLGADRETLIRETARLFGTGRLASVGRPRLESVLTAALRERRLVLRDGVITLPI